jgi:hypothetical protein
MQNVLFPVGRPVTVRHADVYGVVQYESINVDGLMVYGVKWVMKDGAGYDVVSEHVPAELIELEWADESE